MLEKDNKILKYNHGEKSMKAQFIINADLECLLEKRHSGQKNSKKLSSAKVNRHMPSGYLLLKNCPYDLTKKKLDCQRGKNCLDRF